MQCQISPAAQRKTFLESYHIHNGHRCLSDHWVCAVLESRRYVALLTGVFQSGTGYIGSFTALALLEAGYKVVITDNLYNSSAEVINRIELICGKRPFFEKLDITDEKALDAVFEKHPDIDSVIHFAALKVRTNTESCKSTSTIE